MNTESICEKLTGKARLILTAVEVPIMPAPMTQIFILQLICILKQNKKVTKTIY